MISEFHLIHPNHGFQRRWHDLARWRTVGLPPRVAAGWWQPPHPLAGGFILGRTLSRGSLSHLLSNL